jgi:hypothetical protein
MNITGTEMGTLNSQWYHSSHFQVSSEKHEICLWGLPMLRLKCEPSSSTRHTFWTNDLRYTSSFLTFIAGSHEHILVLINTSDIAQFRSKVFPADFNKMQNKNTIFCLICKYLYIFFPLSSVSFSNVPRMKPSVLGEVNSQRIQLAE